MRNSIGIDISKKHFDLCVNASGKLQRFVYDQQGIRQCIQLCKTEQPEIIVMEATGGYERQLAAELMAEGLTVSIVNPKRIRDFAKAVGQIAKTDKLDARIIAQYAAIIQTKPATPKDDNLIEIKELVARRAQLMKALTAEKNRTEHAVSQVIRDSIEVLVKTIEQQLAVIDKQIDHRIDQQPELKEKTAILKTIPGVGVVTSRLVVSELPELGRLNRRQIAMLTGLAPVNRDSGVFKGKRMTGGGRKHIRTGLFMPGLAAIRFNPKIKAFYQRLIKEKGKCKMTALVAAMRKLLCIMNAMVKNNQPWQENSTFLNEI